MQAHAHVIAQHAEVYAETRRRIEEARAMAASADRVTLVRAADSPFTSGSSAESPADMLSDDD